MIINFEVNNYLSYRNETYFSLEKGKRLSTLKSNVLEIKKNTNNDKLGLLKSAVIFGANGSGKTNLLLALNHMKQIILNPNRLATDEFIRPSFTLDNYSESNPSNFSIEFIYEGIQYHYEFKITDTQVMYERLEYFERGSYKVYFERLENEFKVFPFLDDERSEVRSNLLLLHYAQDKNDFHSKNVLQWFVKKLIFIREELKNEEIKKLRKILNKPEKKKELVKFLRLCDIKVESIDTSIDRIQIPPELKKFFKQFEEILGGEDSNSPKAQLIEERYMLNLVYNEFDSSNKIVGEQRVTYANESSGTKMLITLAYYLIDDDNKDCVFLIDEFDDSLHHTLAQTMLKFFNLSENKQFILTSHNLSLLDCDLRQDQIYFVEKKFTGESELYSVFDFDNKKRNQSFIKKYLRGVYGAIPNVSTEDFMYIFGKSKDDMNDEINGDSHE
ncbi:AAA family ATPase [Staphylococcus capitis]